MFKLAFATSKTFDEQRQEMAQARRILKRDTDSEFRKKVEARRSFNKGIAAEYRKHRKIFHNDFHHLYSTGLPFGSSR